MKKTANKGTAKLKKIVALAKKIQAKQGYVTKTEPSKKVYKIARPKAISIASDKLYGKNRPKTLDGAFELKKVNAEATKIQKAGGQKTIPSKKVKVYNMPWPKAISKATKELKAAKKI